MKAINPFFLTDAYKISHIRQYPPGTEVVYSNITARKSRIDGVDDIVVFGIQYLLAEYLVSAFNKGFFEREWDSIEAELAEFFDDYFGPGAVDLEPYRQLHDLGYLPLEIKSLEEGEVCPTGVPFMTIKNTRPEFFWLTNFIETLTQTVLWNPITCATIANRYRNLLDDFAEETSDFPDFVAFQGHNFSMRGMSSVETGAVTDMAHLTSFNGSDTLTGNVLAREYYSPILEYISGSVCATEHAVMCAGGKDDERETFRRLIQDVYPSGVVSIVSDTWNLWDVLTKIAPSLRSEIEARDGKVVFRPDSGDPVKIVCGYKVKHAESLPSSRSQWEAWYEDGYDAICTEDGNYFDERGRSLSVEEVKGCVHLLYEHFGGEVNSKGYIELNPRVGLIYGDSITFERAHQICSKLRDSGFASTNIVFGIGSYTYQYNTRDTFSIACKATWVRMKGDDENGRAIFKAPVTDDGTKNSASGLLSVYMKDDGALGVGQNVTPQAEASFNLLSTVFLDGNITRKTNLGEVREKLRRRRNERSNG